MIKVFPHVKMKHHCLPVQTIVVYAVITWGFNEQERQHTVMLPVPQHKSRRDNYANKHSLFCLPRGKLKRCMLSPSLTCMLSTKNPERKDRRHKINLGWWQQKHDPDYRKKSPVTSQGLSSSWTMKQTVYCGSILFSELIRQYS